MDREETETPDWRAPGNRIGLGIVAMIFVGIVVVVWQPWKMGACADDGDHVIDEESRLCYVIPEGWAQQSAAELAEEAEEDGWYEHTSELDYSGGGEVSAWVEVGSAESYILGEVPADDLEEPARWLASSSEAMSSGDSEVESETFRIGDHNAATATAQVPYALFGTEEPAMWFWVRVTIVKIGDDATVVFGRALGDKEALEADGGVIAALDEIYDSIAVRS